MYQPQLLYWQWLTDLKMRFYQAFARASTLVFHFLVSFAELSHTTKSC
ncbi:hypothetical protein SE1039_15930 [Staphylococcus equorum]|nr:hypothetical protein SE1039_15930 [Staphylococcus equorum]